MTLHQKLHAISGWDYDLSGERYSLGFLVRQLPAKIGDGELYMRRTLIRKWCFGYVRQVRYKFDDIPEDAACKLALFLFEQDVLRKGV